MLVGNLRLAQRHAGGARTDDQAAFFRHTNKDNHPNQGLTGEDQRATDLIASLCDPILAHAKLERVAPSTAEHQAFI